MLFLSERRNLILLLGVISPKHRYNLIPLIQYNVVSFLGHIFRDEDGNRILKTKSSFLWGPLNKIDRNFDFQSLAVKSFTDARKSM